LTGIEPERRFVLVVRRIDADYSYELFSRGGRFGAIKVQQRGEACCRFVQEHRASSPSKAGLGSSRLLMGEETGSPE
jgi:hypothetical protein